MLCTVFDTKESTFYLPDRFYVKWNVMSFYSFQLLLSSPIWVFTSHLPAATTKNFCVCHITFLDFPFPTLYLSRIDFNNLRGNSWSYLHWSFASWNENNSLICLVLNTALTYTRANELYWFQTYISNKSVYLLERSLPGPSTIPLFSIVEIIEMITTSRIIFHFILLRLKCCCDLFATCATKCVLLAYLSVSKKQVVYD